jgi:dihydrofolate synthase / folylpolyglutamate synthase
MPATKLDLEKELSYLNQLERFEKIKPGLARMEKIMAALDHPHKKFKSIHISGTNGKGSTAAMLSAILTAAGLQTGLYTSPYLCRFNERIRINEKDISDQALATLISQVRQTAAEKKINLSFFEFCTAIAY